MIRELGRRSVDYFVIHTGQHYSYNMDRHFFEELELPEPLFVNDTVREFSTHGGQTAEMIKGVENACIEAKPSVVIVGGDANTNLAAAIAVRKLVAIKLAHMEAGLRSHDWQMPEEHNRVMIDHISDILFTTTKTAESNLVHEKVKGEIFYSGNTIVEAVQQNLEIASNKTSVILSKIGEEPYVLLTLHREENVDHEDKLRNVCQAMSRVREKFGLRVIYPCHPRTRARLEQFGFDDLISRTDGFDIIEPVGYLDFLLLSSEADLILTDSGGVQEEACIIKVPCVTLRDNTERPETVDLGSNILAGTEPEKIFSSIAWALSLEKNWSNPYGSGDAAKRIADVLTSELSNTTSSPCI